MKSNRGFSLLETLLYLGIFAIVGGSLFGILTNVVRVSTREVSGDEVATQLQFAMGTINRLVRESSNIDIATTTATTTLKLRMPIEAQDPTCIILSGGVLKLAQGADPFSKHNCTATTTDITTDKVVVDQALFKKLEFPGGHDQVLVDMQFSNLATGAAKISRALRSGISRASAATFDSDLLPNVDNSYEVGFSGTKRWKNISISNVLNLGVINSDPAGIDGSVYYNSTSKTFRGKANNIWGDLGSSLWLATSTNMYSNVTGNVGIGTATPSAQLNLADIYAAGGKNLMVGDDTYFSDVDVVNTLGMYGNQDSTVGSIKLGSGGGIISGYNSNIGIATTTPRSKLDVNGVIRAVGGSYTNPIVPDTVNDASLVIPYGKYVYAESSGGFVRRLLGIDTSNNLDIGQSPTGIISSINLKAGTSGYISFGANNSEAMRVSGGNVGIATTTPASKLSVVGDINYTGNLLKNGIVQSLGAPAFRGALVYNNTIGGMVEWSAETYDTDSIHNTAANKSMLVVPAGVTKVRLSLSTQSNYSGNQTIYLNKNGQATQYPGKVIYGLSGIGHREVASSPVLGVTAGDYFELEATQDLLSDAIGDRNWFAMEIVE